MGCMLYTAQYSPTNSRHCMAVLSSLIHPYVVQWIEWYYIGAHRVMTIGKARTGKMRIIISSQHFIFSSLQCKLYIPFLFSISSIFRQNISPPIHWKCPTHVIFNISQSQNIYPTFLIGFFLSAWLWKNLVTYLSTKLFLVLLLLQWMCIEEGVCSNRETFPLTFDKTHLFRQKRPNYFIEYFWDFTVAFTQYEAWYANIKL